MHRIAIVLADASRARLFSYERTATAGGLHEDLAELTDLVNPARRLRPIDLFSESAPGAGRVGAYQFAFDDHREAHVDAIDDEFARTIVEAIDAQLRATPSRRLIICASTRMLGRLRDARRGPWPGAPAVDEVPRNVVRLSTPELRAYLERRYLLPARASVQSASLP